MDRLTESQTSTTLLGRLRQNPTDQEAWADFVRRYSPGIYNWCRQFGLQDADACDVTQVVLAKLAEKMRTFVYDPAKGSFLGWLRTVTRHAWTDVKERRDGRVRGRGGRGASAFDLIPAEADPAPWMEAEFEREQMHEALARVQGRITPATWQAFHLYVLEGVPARDVATRVGLSVGAVHQTRYRVGAMVKAEIARLESP